MVRSNMMAYSRSGLMVCYSFRVVCINFLLGLQSALDCVVALALEAALAMAGLVAIMLDCCCRDTIVASILAASANLLPHCSPLLSNQAEAGSVHGYLPV